MGHLRPCNCQKHRDDLAGAEPVTHIAEYGRFKAKPHLCCFNVSARVRRQNEWRRMVRIRALPREITVEGWREQLPIPF